MKNGKNLRRLLIICFVLFIAIFAFFYFKQLTGKIVLTGLPGKAVYIIEEEILRGEPEPGCAFILDGLAIQIKTQGQAMVGKLFPLEIILENKHSGDGGIDINLENNCSALNVDRTSEEFWIKGKESKNLTFNLVSYNEEKCLLQIIIKNCDRNKTVDVWLSFFVPRCGNNICEETENFRNCCLDCGCPAPFVCIQNQCKLIAEKPQKVPLSLFLILILIFALIILFIYRKKIFKIVK